MFFGDANFLESPERVAKHDRVGRPDDLQRERDGGWV